MTAQQLKASILQLAIQGKLVPQNPADEPASVLLKKIKAEKDALVKAGKIKKDKHESVIVRAEDGRYLEKKDGKTTDITDEIPFDIPELWEWARLKTLLLQASTGPFGSMLHQSDYVEEGIPLVNPADIINATISDIKIKKVSTSTAERLATYKLSSKDVVIGRRGEMGRSAVVTNRENGWLCGTGCFFVTPSSGLHSDYLVFLLSTPYIKESLLSKSVGTTMNNLNHGILGHLLIPFPPKTEQKRILAKIEELLPHVEEYGKAETALSKLNAELPEQLKKSILQWAIQGRLVPQDPTDEPASELLKRIHAEKASLIKSGKLKPDKHESVIVRNEDGRYLEKKDGKSTDITDEIPFELPEQWSFVRFGNVVINHDSKRRPVTKDKRKTEYGYFDYYGATGAIDKVDNYLFDGEYLMIGEDGGNFFTERDNSFVAIGKFWANNHVHVVQPIILNIYYLKCFLDSCNLAKMGLINGIAVPKLNQANMNSIIVAVPPLAEQKRIVERIEKLMSTLYSFN